ncbi:FAD-dependent oxidoreductase [Amycolatopsis jejuensis]|uniref:FAD-dependent oxidoreductase n=1 Tax=Amycolatopsis jejuensis TaxID=330084 RepID=UPI000527BB5A|nr:FAD-dependent oxidoreductase [Amycolatopsis jejuensis]
MASVPPAPLSLFDRVFDVVVVGSGYAGYAATITLRRAGRSVLLIGPHGDLLWESGRAFCPDVGACPEPAWRDLVDAVARRTGGADGALDGAVAEVVATDQLVANGAEVLYYAVPVAVEEDQGALTSLIVATKSGLRRVAGRRWLDATESGELVRLVSPESVPRRPGEARAALMLQHPDWSTVPGASSLRITAWPSERVMSFDLPPDEQSWRERVPKALAELETMIGAEIARVSMSHFSIRPIPRYRAGVPAEIAVPNLASAVPGLHAGEVTTLADRFVLGVRSAARLLALEDHEVPPQVLARAIQRIVPARTLTTEVLVAGAGTGGALAAVAAARAGARVMCVEPTTFVGGIGTGGGIHVYWFGVPGGLQHEVDLRTREVMRSFRGGPFGDGPFNPWAKMVVLERMLREHSVDLHTDALLFDVERHGDRVVAALVATPDGVVRIEAGGFVDASGDGDLCAAAGAEFSYGREHDGLLHAYSQSSGKLRDLRGRPRMAVVNIDAGFCDPVDPLDITRARLTGIRQHLRGSYTNLTRPTYIAPALGIRQSRQFVTEYTLSLDDLIRRRRFADVIGYTGAHYDNHATDCEFESDESVFWMWANRQFSAPLVGEMSYRMVVPRGLGNVWIASRCLGVSQDAHYSCRMQRDVQRVGEAAGYAAALAVRSGTAAQQLPYPDLREWLDKTGALDKEPRNITSGFTWPDPGEAPMAELEVPDLPSSAAEALAALDRGEPGEAMWWLYRNEPSVRDDVMHRLAAAEAGPMVSWLAAAVVAMWKDPAAEPRLIAAVESHEYGFGGSYGPPPGYSVRPGEFDPFEQPYLAPNWLCAVALLRRCGTEACLPALERLLARPVHGINTLTTVALTLERIARRIGAPDTEVRDRIGAMLDRMFVIRTVGSLDHAGRSVGKYSECAIRGVYDADDHRAAEAEFASGHFCENNGWQLHLAVARARAAMNLPAHGGAERYLGDARALVRRAFATVRRTAEG